MQPNTEAVSFEVWIRGPEPGSKALAYEGASRQEAVTIARHIPRNVGFMLLGFDDDNSLVEWYDRGHLESADKIVDEADFDIGFSERG